MMKVHDEGDKKSNSHQLLGFEDRSTFTGFRWSLPWLSSSPDAHEGRLPQARLLDSSLT